MSGAIGSSVVPFASSKKRRRSVSPLAEKPHAWTKKDVDNEVSKYLRRRYITGFKPEMKFILDASAFVNITAAGGALNLINGCIQGITDNTRIGNKVKLIKCEVNYCIRIPNTANNAGDNGTVALFLYKDPQGAAPAAFAAGTGVDSPYYLASTGGNVSKQDDYRSSFAYLMEDRFALNPGIGSGVALIYSYLKPVVKTIQLGQVVQFNQGNAGSVADMIKGALYFGRASTEGLAQIEWNMKTWYTDV